MAPSAVVTVPVPEPYGNTPSVKLPPLDESKKAPAKLSLFMVREQAPVPLHPPLHCPSAEAEFGVADRVTTVPAV